MPDFTNDALFFSERMNVVPVRGKHPPHGVEWKCWQTHHPVGKNLEARSMSRHGKVCGQNVIIKTPMRCRFGPPQIFTSNLSTAHFEKLLANPLVPSSQKRRIRLILKRRKP
jgi:hypothetical protein